jgi:hypothetical protein
MSAFFYVSPKNGVLITGELKPKVSREHSEGVP